MDTSDDMRDRAVRNYLIYLEDPQRLVDVERVAELEHRAAHTNDVIERVKAYSDLERAQHPDEAEYRAAFVRHAKTWADENGASWAGFERMNVPRAVLTEAGLANDDAADTGRKATRRVTVEQAKSAIRSLGNRFTAPDAIEVSGASPMTVRRAITQLVDEGDYRRTGRDPDWKRRGRAPIVYERTT